MASSLGLIHPYLGNQIQYVHHVLLGKPIATATKPTMGIYQTITHALVKVSVLMALESGTPGRAFTTKDSPTKLRYNYVSFWVDHMSTFVYITFHSSKATTELVWYKTKFEQYAAQYNICIENIHVENGVYSAQLFKDACVK